jgi:hypothetical protein
MGARSTGDVAVIGNDSRHDQNDPARAGECRSIASSDQLQLQLTQLVDHEGDDEQDSQRTEGLTKCRAMRCPVRDVEEFADLWIHARSIGWAFEEPQAADDNDGRCFKLAHYPSAEFGWS